MKPFDLLEYAYTKFPNKTALRSAQNETVSYKKLFKRSKKLGCSLAAYGVKPGDDVIIYGRNSIQFIEAIFASSFIGAIPTLLNINWSAEVAVACVRDPEARVAAAFVDAYSEEAILLARELVKLGIVVIALDQAIPGTISYEKLFDGEAPSDTLEPFIFCENDTILQLYTSGTTGVPKCVMLSRKNFEAWLLMTIVDERWTHDDVMLITFPFFHVAGLCFFKSIVMGAEVVVGSGVRAEDLEENIAKFSITRCGFPPILLDRLTARMEQTGSSFPLLRSVGYGSTCISPELMERCNFYLKCDMRQAYGMTETITAGASLTPEEHTSSALLNTVGKPMLGVRLKIVNEFGALCQEGESGEIAIKSDAVMKGYRGNPSLTNEVIQDGWYYTKDIGYLDEAGYHHIQGRKDDMIISGGENMFPSELADCIKSMRAAVEDVAVLGVEDKTWGKIPVAFVVKQSNSDITEREIVDTCAKKLGRYKKPRQVFFIDSIPRGQNGKVIAEDLRTIYRQLVG